MARNDVVPSMLLEGLALDVSILQSLLKRHRCNHGRALYYRRMDMTLKSIERSNVFESISYLHTKFYDRVDKYQQDRRKQKQKRQRYEKRSNMKEEEKWALSSTAEDESRSVQPPQPDEDQPVKLIWKDLGRLIHTWTLAIEEIFSRIHHASRVLFIEVSRGFFLPFCSVSLSALSRIRALLMEIGQLCLQNLYHLQNELRDDVITNMKRKQQTSMKQLVPEVHLTEAQFCQYMGMYMEDESTTGEEKTLSARINNRKAPDVTATLAMLGIHRPSLDKKKNTKKKVKGKKSAKNTVQESNDNNVRSQAMSSSSSSKPPPMEESQKEPKVDESSGKLDNDDSPVEDDLMDTTQGGSMEISNNNPTSTTEQNIDVAEPLQHETNRSIVDDDSEHDTNPKPLKKKKQKKSKVDNDSAVKTTKKKKKKNKKTSSASSSGGGGGGDFFDELFS